MQSGSGISIPLTDTWADVSEAGPPSYPGSTQWIYNANDPGDSQSSPSYVSFKFPAECGTESGLAAQYLVNQQALEFLFFDLSSCVQDDTEPPTQPPPSK